MVESHFSRFEGSEPAGFSGSQFGFVVEAFNNSAGDLLFGAEPVEQQRFVAPKCLGELFDRRKT